MSENYATLHLHSELSLLDSATKFQDYINRAVELGQKAIAFTEHGNCYQWVAKKLACDAAGIKYIHGVECYLTEKLLWEDPRTGETSRVRDNFHTILLAKNMDGLREINELVSRSSTEDHFYYKPRITFDEFLGISNNVIKMSACLASPLNRLPITHPLYERLVKHYDYLEIQPHNHPDQIAFNRHLAEMSQKYGIPLVATTDTHSLDKYKAECRTMMQLAKHIEFADEDTFDLTYKSYDELCEMFRAQDAIPEKLWAEAIENTNVIADSVDAFDLDKSFKYPILYGERDRSVLMERIEQGLQAKLASGAVTHEQEAPFRAAIQDEMHVFDKIEMSGFMLFMSELATWCKTHDIPLGFNRGSCGGSRVAFLTDTTDLNPETWKTVFSRFANEDRKEIGDIDIDVSPSDRDKVYEYIINRFGQEKTAYILAIGTIKSKGAIDEICRGLGVRWDKEHLHDLRKLKQQIADLKTANSDEAKALQKEYERLKKENDAIYAKNPWIGKISTQIKDEFEVSEEKTREKYPEVFYFYDGLLDVAISQSMHPAGIVASPITLRDNYGTFLSDGKEILQIDMDCVHDAGLVKYDILGLKNVEIIKDAYKLIGAPYPKSHEINWNDEAVWKDMLRSPVGIFQFEGDFAFSMLKQYEPHSIFDMSLITAALRPSGASYRDDLMKHKPHKNPSAIIDELLADNYGYLVYQEDVIKFLQQICGYSGSAADNTRRMIARKKPEELAKALPDILDGYCKMSPQPREVAEQEAKEFVQIISDASSYMFGYNHSIGYCMIGYLCAYLRYYHPYEFITAYLNNANGEEDVKSGNELAVAYGIKIVPPRFGRSKDRYLFDKDEQFISKGIASVKYLNAEVANQLYELSHVKKPDSFMELLRVLDTETRLDTRQRDILIRLDYFSEYGNARELLRMVELFAYFKNGTAKKISKEKLNNDLEEIVSRHATDAAKNGTVAKSYTITDMDGLLAELEETVRGFHLEDFDFKSKMQDQLENLGYVDLTSGDEKDRRKLIIMDVYPLKSKKDGAVWGYALQTRSIGSGKTARLTLRASNYKKQPIRKFDVIFAKSISKNQAGFWYLNGYNVVI